MAKYSRDDLDRFHDYGIHIPTRTIYMGSETSSEFDGESGVDFLMAERIVKNLHILDAMGDQPITIIMNNVGGDVYHGMAIYDAIKACRNKVIIHGMGNVMSMATLILQAGDERILSPHAVFMIHHGYDRKDGHVKTVRSWIKFGERFDEILNLIYLDRIRQKKPQFTMKKLDKLLDFDTILTAQEAVNLGLADSVQGEGSTDE